MFQDYSVGIHSYIPLLKEGEEGEERGGEGTTQSTEKISHEDQRE